MAEPALQAVDGKSDVGLEEFTGFADNSPINIMYCDRDFVIRYVNPKSLETLSSIEEHLPCRVNEILGANIDIFHKNPSHQRRMLESDRNLPHRATISVGPEQLDLLVSAVYDKSGKFIGCQVTWDVVTEKLKNETEMARIQSMMENAPVNVMYCDLDFNIVYVNPKSIETLTSIEQHLPVRVSEMVGTNIDVFHKSPEHQRRLLRNDKNLPHRTMITVGPEKLDLLVSPIYDHSGEYLGPMVTWEVVTEKVKADAEMATISNMVDNAPVNIMLADRDLNLVFMNPKSKETLRTLQQHLPKPVDQLIGESIDIFHKDPSHQRNMLKDDRNLPHRAKIKVGDDTLDLLVSPIYDNNGQYSGPMVTWEVITDKVRLVENLTQASQQLAAAAEELNVNANQMSANAEETTAQATSASSAAEEVAQGVGSVATNTEEMNAAIKEIARNANEASSMSQETRTQAESTNDTIAKLGTSSQEIGNVIKVISSIAQQTNLLALNATIEAARAGDAGRGFAVVANEVKELAKQTASATEEITNKINAIQQDSTGAIDAIQIIGKSIETLNGIAGSIAASVEEQMATTSEVARVVQDSNQGVQGITQNIVQVSKAADETSKGSSELVAAAKGLGELAAQMRELVDEIKV